MPPKTLIIACAALLTSAATFPAAAQQMMRPEAATPQANDGPSHMLTGAAVIFNMMDGDGDGALDMGEVGALTQAIFTTLDRDEDGKLSKDEINAALRQMQASRSAFGPRPGGPDADRGTDGPAERFREALRNGQWHRPGGPRPAPTFGNIDTNNDGVISQDEFQAATRRPAQEQ